jgi:hypothetical protein
MRDGYEGVEDKRESEKANIITIGNVIDIIQNIKQTIEIFIFISPPLTQTDMLKASNSFRLQNFVQNKSLNSKIDSHIC